MAPALQPAVPEITMDDEKRIASIIIAIIVAVLALFIATVAVPSASP